MANRESLCSRVVRHCWKHMMIYVRRAESEKGLEVRDSEKVYLHLKVSPVLKKLWFP